MRALAGGILMPSYACTLDCVPIPVTPDYARILFDRLAPAIDYIHLCGWFHGDIKPSNTFIGADGQLWLGDYGSSAQYSTAYAEFCGGTPRYQCRDCLAVEAKLHRFDKIGLIISILEKIGAIYSGADLSKKDCYSYDDIVTKATALDRTMAAWLDEQ